MIKIRYFLTYHAIERFQERFSEIAKNIKEINFWTRSQNVNSIKQFFDKMLDESKENRSYLNNSNHMINLYENYGYDKEYKFMENLENGILFILAKERSENNFIMVTVMPSEYKNEISLKKVQYKKKPNKKLQHQEKILSLYNEMIQNNVVFENKNLEPLERLTDLENHNDFSKKHPEILSELLLALTLVEQYQNEKVIYFQSQKNEYCFKLNHNKLEILMINPLSKEKTQKRTKYFRILNNLHSLNFNASIKEIISDDITINTVIYDNFLYDLKYYKSIDSIEIIKKNRLNSEKLLNHVNNNEIINKISNKIKIEDFIVINKSENGEFIYETDIENMTLTFDFDKIDKKIQIREAKYIDQTKVDSNNETMNFKLESKKNTANTFNTNLETKNYLEEGFDFSTMNLNVYESLTNSLTEENKLMLKKLAIQENTILIQINKRKAIHKIIYEGIYYEYMMNKTRTQGYILTLLKSETEKVKITNSI